MQPSNPRSEMGASNQSTNSVVDVLAQAPSGKGSVQNNQQQQQPEEPRRLSLAELFAEDGDSEDSSQPIDDPSKPPDSLEGLSKRLGVKPEQIYDVKIPLKDGAEPLTIGQLKDRVSELVDLETRETQFEQRRLRSEGDMLRAQAEIRELLTMVPKEHIRPEIVDKIRKRHDANMQREREMTLEHIPDWHDEKKRAEDLQGMIDFLGDYGFDETFIGTVSDHRAIKFIRDMYLRDKRIKTALSKVTIPEGKGHRASSKTKKPAARPQQYQSQRKNTVPDSRARISALFNQSE